MFEGYAALVVLLGMLAIKGYALVNACLWPSAAYTLTHRQTKQLWLGILATGLLLDLVLIWHPVALLSFAFLVPALVYLLDVRPAVAGITRRQ
jgi:hypothetical protein